AEDHVLFSPQAMNAANSVLPRYGALANRSLDEMIAGARVDVAPYKRDATDFVLWKPAKPGEPSWTSPSGIEAEGRPGWHIECSAMAWKHLGEQFDIHGGGIDLVFPHHENELAQSCCAFHSGRMANIWMHNGFLQVEGDKMSKSLGNFVTIRELLQTDKFGGRNWSGAALRLAMFKTHYRQPIDWTVQSLIEAEQVMAHWKMLVSRVPIAQIKILPTQKLERVLLDDLNVSESLSELHDLARIAQKDASARDRLYANLVFLGLLPDQLELAKQGAAEIQYEIKLPEHPDATTLEVFRPKIEKGLERFFLTLPSSANTTATTTTASVILTGEVRYVFLDNWTKYNPYYLSQPDRAHVENTIGIEKLNNLIRERLNARARKDFNGSDRIRDELAAKGCVLKDGKDPATGEPTTTWEI